MTSLPRTVVAVVVLALVWRYVDNVLRAHAPSHCGGHVHPAFQEVKETFCANVASGVEPGASFAVYHQGELLVNLWGGHADPSARKPWTQDTLSQAWSSTKGATAVVIALLVDRGLIEYDKPVKVYWPEFAANGKENITVATLLSHRAGLMYLGRQLSLLEYRDNWPEVERLMAEQTPAWQPGTMCAYHAFTLGMYADALVRKVDPQHRNISQFFRDEIAKPLDLDFYIGLPPDQYFRSARASYVTLGELFVNKFLLQPGNWVWLPEAIWGTLLDRSIRVFDFMEDVDKMNDAELQSIGMSSSNGFGNARALAKLYDFLANDGQVQGKRLLSPKQTRVLSTPVTTNTPKIAGSPGVDAAMGTVVEQNVLGRPIFGHRGYGGQNGFADPQYGVGVSYITNFNSRFSDCDDPRALQLLTTLYKCLQTFHD